MSKNFKSHKKLPDAKLRRFREITSIASNSIYSRVKNFLLEIFKKSEIFFHKIYKNLSFLTKYFCTLILSRRFFHEFIKHINLDKIKSTKNLICRLVLGVQCGTSGNLFSTQTAGKRIFEIQ